MALVDIHEEVYKLLLKEGERNSKLKFRPRKTNRSNRLRDGYWFLGNDQYLSIPFWEGMNWKTRSPNISMVVDYEGNAWLQVNTSDSDEKTDFVKKYLVRRLGLKKIQDKDYKYMKGYPNAKDYKDVFKQFFQEDYHIIDYAIKNQFDKQQFENLPFNIIDDETFFGDLDWINKFREENSQLDSKISNIKPSKLIGFHINNYGPIKSSQLEEIPVDSNWIFITGENGVGKTSLLKAIASAIGHRFVHSVESENVESFKVDMVLAGVKNDVVRITRKANADTKKRKPYTVGFAAYGPMRLLSIHSGLSSKSLKRAHGKSGMFESLFSNGGYLLDLETEMKFWDKDGEHGFSEIRRRYITELLQEAMPNIGVVKLSFDFNDFLITLFQEIDSTGELLPPVTIDKLSSGYLSIAAMLSDMIARLFKQQPDCVDLASLRGIVIIDEIDIHLHPKFQKHLVVQLSEAFPNVQFIVSTHSPIPLLGAPQNSIIVNITRTVKEGVVLTRLDDKMHIEDLLPNTILTSPIFGLDKITHDKHDKTSNVRTEETYQELKFNNEIKNEINEVYTKTKEEELIALFKKRRDEKSS